MLNELVKKYSECLLNVNMIDADSRADDNEVEIDGSEKTMQNGYHDQTMWWFK